MLIEEAALMIFASSVVNPLLGEFFAAEVFESDSDVKVCTVKVFLEQILHLSKRVKTKMRFGADEIDNMVINIGAFLFQEFKALVEKISKLCRSERVISWSKPRDLLLNRW